MRYVRLTVAYDGTDFFGWQLQPQHRTVQGVLEEAIFRVTGESLRVVAAGRTDTGVHALGQVVSFATHSPYDNQVLLKAINANLPADVTALEVHGAPQGFNAIDASCGKRYRYLIQDGPVADVFARKYAWRIRKRLNAAAMNESARSLCGTHDFRSFQNEGSPRVSTIRTVRDLLVERRPYAESERLVLEIEADGFLYNMVRNIVGTLVEVGKGKHSVEWPLSVLASKDRTQAGMCAPPHGLYLVKVLY